MFNYKYTKGNDVTFGNYGNYFPT